MTFLSVVTLKEANRMRNRGHVTRENFFDWEQAKNDVKLRSSALFSALGSVGSFGWSATLSLSGRCGWGLDGWPSHR